MCQVAALMTEGPTRTKVKASEFRFKPVRGWLGGEQTETIEGWKTKVFEATGKMHAVTTTKVGACCLLCWCCSA